MTKSIPVALTIAGSDNSAGAGIQADLKTFHALGVYGLSAVTCVVAEIPGRISRIEPIEPEMVREQIQVLAKDFPIAAIETYQRELFPLATLITPNLDEAIQLRAGKITDRKSMERAGKELARKFKTAILLKGGHLSGNEAVDLLFAKGKVSDFSTPFVRGMATHGTGCTYSAAITANLAAGKPLADSILRD